MNQIQQNIAARVRPLIAEQEKKLKETREMIDKFRNQGFSINALLIKQADAESQLQRLKGLL